VKKSGLKYIQFPKRKGGAFLALPSCNQWWIVSLRLEFPPEPRKANAEFLHMTIRQSDLQETPFHYTECLLTLNKGACRAYIFHFSLTPSFPSGMYIYRFPAAGDGGTGTMSISQVSLD